MRLASPSALAGSLCDTLFLSEATLLGRCFIVASASAEGLKVRERERIVFLEPQGVLKQISPAG